MTEAEYREKIRPLGNTGATAYTLELSDQMETSRGVAWTGVLYRDGSAVGTVEDDGNGGAPYVHIDTPEERALWSATIQAAYPANSMGEEDFIAHLDFTAEGL